MKWWWRSLFISIVLMAIFALPAGAEKLDWTDPSYDFTRVKRVLIYDVNADEVSGLIDDLEANLVQEEYLKTAAKPKYEMLRPDKAEKLSPGAPNLAADLYVTTELLQWQDGYYIKPEYTSWETRTKTREKKHKDGSTTTETYTVDVPIYHPPQTIYTSTVRVRFKVHDSKTGNCVMERDERRERDNSRHGQQGIFGRISKAFFDDLGKKLKPAEE